MPSSNVTVCIRLRPFLPREKGPAVVQAAGNTARIQVEVGQLYGTPEVEHRQFVFDLCFNQDSSQEAVYEQVGEPIFCNALEGFSSTLFAYGQTGSGKSFTVMGSEHQQGIIPRLTAHLFEVIAEDPRPEKAKEVRISVSFLEIYNEEIRDLLDPRPKRLDVHQHPKLGVYMPHLTEAAAESAAECSRLLDFGAKIRATAQTSMNSTSSRSHSVFTLRITQVFPNGKIRNSSVHLCDLGGSERAKKSGAQGLRMREGSSINNSLSVLGQVISKLAAGGADKKGVHVPFRQSKLTYLLMDALSGNSVTTMVATVSPAHSEWEESLSTLRFAESVKKVRTKPQLVELAPEEPEMLLQTLIAEMEVLREALVKETTRCPGKNSPLARELDASQQLMRSFSTRAGSQWEEALEQTRALKALQKQLLEAMSLQKEIDVSQLVGVDSSTPDVLNISDDPGGPGSLLSSPCSYRHKTEVVVHSARAELQGLEWQRPLVGPGARSRSADPLLRLGPLNSPPSGGPALRHHAVGSSSAAEVSIGGSQSVPSSPPRRLGAMLPRGNGGVKSAGGLPLRRAEPTARRRPSSLPAALPALPTPPTSTRPAATALKESGRLLQKASRPASPVSSVGERASSLAAWEPHDDRTSRGSASDAEGTEDWEEELARVDEELATRTAKLQALDEQQATLCARLRDADHAAGYASAEVARLEADLCRCIEEVQHTETVRLHCTPRATHGGRSQLLELVETWLPPGARLAMGLENLAAEEGS